MQEIAYPYGYGIETEERNTLHLPDRHDTLPDAVDGFFHLIIYSKSPKDKVEQDEYGNTTNGGDQPSGSSKLADDVVETSACSGKEGSENLYLHDESQCRDTQHQQRIDSPFCHDGTDSFRERHVIVAFQHSAPSKLAYTGDDEADGIGEEDAVDADGGSWMFA